MKRKKEEAEERKTRRKLIQKQKFSNVLKSKSHQSTTTTSSTSTKKKKENGNQKLSHLDLAYSKAGICGNDLYTAGKKIFEQVLVSMPTKEFFDEIFEQVSTLQCRNNPLFYVNEWFDSNEFIRLLNSGKISSDDVTLTRYKNSSLETKPFWKESWEEHFNKDGYSIRLLRPQTENDKLWRLCSLLEAFWGKSCGMNAYWTPKGENKSFEYHYDNVDIFLLQIEGHQKCQVYENQEEEDALPLETSQDFQEEDLVNNFQLVHDVILAPGDSIYIPRGFVYRVESTRDENSLFLSISMGVANKMTYSHLLEKVFQFAVESAKRQNVQLRQSLPHQLGSYMGAQYSDNKEDIRRDEFNLKVLTMVKESIMKNLDMDDAVDSIIGDFMFDRHRPARKDDDDDDEESDEIDETRLGLESVVEVAIVGASRICIENGMAIVRHCMKNSRLVNEVESRGIEFDIDDATTIEAILEKHETPFAISTLPEVLTVEGEEPEEYGGRIRVVTALLNEGILRLVKY